MAFLLASATIRHERRVRLAFTDALLAGAFAAGLYAVSCPEGSASPPIVTKALAVASSPNVVELQLDTDLVPGALYAFSAPGVPGSSGSTPSPSTELARFGEQPAAVSLSLSGPAASLERALYGLDLAWTGSDFAEGPGGDLDTADGLALLEADLTRRLLANGLPWDPSYGLRAREAVDGAPTALVGLRGRAAGQLLLDDRVALADATVDLADPAEPTIVSTAVPVGASIFQGDGAIALRTTL